MTQPLAKRYPGPPLRPRPLGCRFRRRPARLVGQLTALVATVLLAAPPAAAIQPLAEFLRAAEGYNFDLLQSGQAYGQRAQEARAATGRLLPVVQLGATYTRNQFAAEFPLGDRLLTLAPHDQFDAIATLNVPIVDVVSWARRKVAHHTADAAREEVRRTRLAAARQIAEQYYGLRGSEGKREAAAGSLAFAERALGLMRDKQAVGTASALDVARAESDRADAVQQVANAQLQVVLARRGLQTLTGLLAEPAGSLPEVDLTGEAPLDAWLAKIDGALPAVAGAQAQEDAARAGDRAARYGYVPTVSVTATERMTNASALNGGHEFVWTAKANVSWQFDATLTPSQKAQAYAARGAGVRSAQVRRQVADAIFRDYAQIEANQAQSLAARAQVRATKLAETLALDKAAAGLLTQLDVTQARRDAFAAEVNRIQADANLLYYRALLRLDSAKDVSELEEFAP